MPPVGFETTNSAGERPQTQALDRAAKSRIVHIIKMGSLPYHFHLITAYFRQRRLDVLQIVQTGPQAQVFSSSTRNGRSFTDSKAAGART